MMMMGLLRLLLLRRVTVLLMLMVVLRRWRRRMRVSGALTTSFDEILAADLSGPHRLRSAAERRPTLHLTLLVDLRLLLPILLRE